MISLIKILVKVLEAKLEKTGIEQLILKNQNYITEAKNVWNMVNENDRISTSIEEKLKSKADQFDAFLLKKFPELTQDDVTNLRQSIAGEINKDKAAVIDNSTIIKQLQDTNTQLISENVSLKDQLSKVQSLITVGANSANSGEIQTPNAGNTAQSADTNQVSPTANNPTMPVQAVAQA